MKIPSDGLIHITGMAIVRSPPMDPLRNTEHSDHAHGPYKASRGLGVRCPADPNAHRTVPKVQGLRCRLLPKSAAVHHLHPWFRGPSPTAGGIGSLLPNPRVRPSPGGVVGDHLHQGPHQVPLELDLWSPAIRRTRSSPS